AQGECHLAKGATGMRPHMTSYVAVLLCMLVLAACGSGTSQTDGPPLPKTSTTLPSAATVSATISGLGDLDQFGYDIEGNDNAIWVHNGASGKLFRIDPKTNTRVATISIGSGEGDVALGQGAVWVVSSAAGTVSRPWCILYAAVRSDWGRI